MKRRDREKASDMPMGEAAVGTAEAWLTPRMPRLYLYSSCIAKKAPGQDIERCWGSRLEAVSL